MSFLTTRLSKGSRITSIKHYESCLEKYGDSHLGVDWPNADEAETRYRVMLDVVDPSQEGVSMLDFGCGASHFYQYLQRQGIAISYSGLDISPKFIDLSRQKFPDIEYYCCDILVDSPKVPVHDYVIMNGVFTEKRSLTFDEMFDYFQRTLAAAFGKARIAVAFNVMSKQVDWERDDLFHLPIDTLAEFLTRSLSRHFVIRHDYGLYEYTVYLYGKARN